jgi:PPK2 family polyphosphate:nucleotide phosphotransferase
MGERKAFRMAYNRELLGGGMKEYRVNPGAKVKLDDFSTLPPEKGESFKAEIKRQNEKLILKLADWQDAFYAEHKHRLLVILQGLDTSGKDGVIRNVFAHISPQGLRVQAFKAPTQIEREHDYLWRVHSQVPGDGEIVVFNRSHYEEVLVARVQGLVEKERWIRRYRHIVEFERMLVDEGTSILKFFLHISKDEQKKRLLERLEQKRKNWKWDSSDLRDRAYWDRYIEAYEDMLEKTSTAEAPWYVVPADKKWWRDHVVAETLIACLERLNPQYPKPKVDLSRIRFD